MRRALNAEPRAGSYSPPDARRLRAMVLASNGAASMCGVRLPLNGRPLFLALCTGAICSAVGFAALQEGVWQIPGYTFSGWMTLVTLLTMTVCGQLERLLTCDTVRVGALVQYLKLSVLTLAGMHFTNWSLKYLNYPTRVLFKSSKLIPTMVAGTIMQGRRYSALEYLAALGLIVGIILFTMGDAVMMPSFDVTGVGLILIGVAADAATSNYEEAVFFRSASPASQAEVMTFASLFGCGWALLLDLLFSDELKPAIKHTMHHPTVLPMLVGSSVCGYVSVSFVLLLIKLYGATVTEMVKSMRKVITVVLSFALYPKPISFMYYLGGGAVLSSLAATHELQRRKGGDGTLTESEPAGDATEADSEAQPLATEAIASSS